MHTRTRNSRTKFIIEIEGILGFSRNQSGTLDTLNDSNLAETFSQVEVLYQRIYQQNKRNNLFRIVSQHYIN